MTGATTEHAPPPSWERASQVADAAASRTQDLADLVGRLADGGDKRADKLRRFATHLAESVNNLADRVDGAADAAGLAHGHEHEEPAKSSPTDTTNY